MPSLSQLWHFLWLVRAIFVAVLLLVVFWRQLHRNFPMFALYVTWAAAAGIVLLAMDELPFFDGNQYTVGFMADSLVETCLSFAVIYEIFKRNVRHYPALDEAGTTAFRWITIALVAAAIALAWFAPAHGEGRLIASYFVVERTVRTLQCGLLLFLFAFCAYFRLTWRSQAFGVALGLSILISTSLAVAAIQSQIEPTRSNSATDILALASQTAYLGCALLWIAYCLASEQVREDPAGTLPPEQDLRTWNQELQRLLP